MSDSKNTWVVYSHTSPSGKVYVGITHHPDPNKRWLNGHGYKGHQHLIKNAIKKYGWSNFKHNILFENCTEEFAKIKEKELISYYKDLGISYNLTDGGDGKSGIIAWNKGIPQTDAQKQVNRERNSGSNNGFYGKHHSEETKDKLRKSHIGKPAWNKGIPRTAEEKAKMSQSHMGHINSIESNLKRSQTLKGRVVSEETKEKIRQKLKGQPKSEEHKKHISESRKRNISSKE